MSGKRKREDDTIDVKKSNDAPPFSSLVAVFRVLVSLNFLNSKQIGQLLLFVSKSLSTSIFDDRDELWKTICYSHWGQETTIMLLEGIGGASPEDVFLGLTKDVHLKNFHDNTEVDYDADDEAVVERRDNPSAKYSLQDYRFVVMLYDENGVRRKVLLFDKFESDEFESFLRDGYIWLEITNNDGDNNTLPPIELEWEEGSIINELNPYDKGWSAVVHLWLIPKCKCICIFNGKTCSSSFYPDFGEQVFHEKEETSLTLDTVGQRLLKQYVKHPDQLESSCTGINFAFELWADKDFDIREHPRKESLKLSRIHIEARSLFGSNLNYEQFEMSNHVIINHEVINHIDFAHVLERLHAFQ